MAAMVLSGLISTVLITPFASHTSSNFYITGRGGIVCLHKKFLGSSWHLPRTYRLHVDLAAYGSKGLPERLDLPAIANFRVFGN